MVKQNILYAIVALKNRLIDNSAFSEICSECVVNPGTDTKELVKKYLDESDYSKLEKLVANVLHQNSSDLLKSLEKVGAQEIISQTVGPEVEISKDLYNKYKRKIYEKSVNENLKWFEIFLNQNYLRDARTCLQLYKLHAEEINIFDQEKYEEMSKRLRK